MTAAAQGPAAVRARMSFYVWLAIAVAAVAFLGFAPTYWVAMARGSFHATPLVHAHGFAFFAWTLLLVYQTQLVSGGKVAVHRDVGLIGIALAGVMTVLGLAVAIRSVMRADGTEFEHAARSFLIVPVVSIALFAGLFAAAVANVRRPEWHKRLLFVGTVQMLEAAVARWFFLLLAPPLPPGAQPPPPSADAMTGYIADLLILAGVIYDWRTRGRPHPAYLIGGGIVLVWQLIRVPVSETAAWHAIAAWLLSFGA